MGWEVSRFGDVRTLRVTDETLRDLGLRNCEAERLGANGLAAGGLGDWEDGDDKVESCGIDWEEKKQ